MAIGLSGDTLDLQKLVELRVQTILLQQGLLAGQGDDVPGLRTDAEAVALVQPNSTTQYNNG